MAQVPGRLQSTANELTDPELKSRVDGVVCLLRGTHLFAKTMKTSTHGECTTGYT